MLTAHAFSEYARIATAGHTKFAPRHREYSMHNTNVRRKNSQHGVSLIESLVAIVVMSLGILGILGVQMRTLADTQTSVRRAQAVRLIDDLSERLSVNPNALSNINNYPTAFGATPATPARNCATTPCSNSELAAYDLSQWKQSVKNTLPASDAAVFLADADTNINNRRQLGIMISWRENERDTAGTYKNAINAGVDGGAVTCPAERTCHLQYISVSARCAPYFADTAAQFFCAATTRKS